MQSHEHHRRNINFNDILRGVYVGDLFDYGGSDRDDDRGWTFDSDDGYQWLGLHGVGADSHEVPVP